MANQTWYLILVKSFWKIEHSTNFGLPHESKFLNWTERFWVTVNERRGIFRSNFKFSVGLNLYSLLFYGKLVLILQHGSHGYFVSFPSLSSMNYRIFDMLVQFFFWIMESQTFFSSVFASHEKKYEDHGVEFYATESWCYYIWVG